MQVIYRATHLPTNKPYIGYRSDEYALHRYKTSSNLVKNMMTNNPDEWKIEVIVCILQNVSQRDGLDLEKVVIRQYRDDCGGWNGVWNRYGKKPPINPIVRETIRRIVMEALPAARKAISATNEAISTARKAISAMVAGLAE